MTTPTLIRRLLVLGLTLGLTLGAAAPRAQAQARSRAQINQDLTEVNKILNELNKQLAVQQGEANDLDKVYQVDKKADDEADGVTKAAAAAMNDARRTLASITDKLDDLTRKLTAEFEKTDAYKAALADCERAAQARAAAREAALLPLKATAPYQAAYKTLMTAIAERDRIVAHGSADPGDLGRAARAVVEAQSLVDKLEAAVLAQDPGYLAADAAYAKAQAARQALLDEFLGKTLRANRDWQDLDEQRTAARGAAAGAESTFEDAHKKQVPLDAALKKSSDALRKKKDEVKKTQDTQAAALKKRDTLMTELQRALY